MSEGHRDYRGLVGVHIWESGIFGPLRALGSPCLFQSQIPLTLEQPHGGVVGARRVSHDVHKIGFEL